MSNGFWSDDESISDFDMIQDQPDFLEDLEDLSPPEIVEASEEDIQKVMEESSYEVSASESNTIYNAKLRLEQARLYEMLINHDIFEGVDANEDAVSIVKNELKLYIVRRLEILLGIRKPKIRQERVETADSFNSIEKEFLKQLAYKGTLGQSASAEPASKEKAPLLSPIKANKPPKGLNTLNKKQATRQEPQPTKPQKNTTQVRVQEKSKVKLEPSGKGRALTQKEAMEIAKKELEESAGKKPFHELSAKEKKERMKEVNEKYKKPRPQSALPFPTAAQLEQQYTMRQQLNSGSNNQSTQFNSILANILANKK